MTTLTSLTSAELDTLAGDLQVSRRALDTLAASDVIDLHIDTFIPVRLWGYDIAQRHGPGWQGGRFFGHLDLPRMEQSGLTGAMWSITTNPLRSAAGRWRTLLRNATAFQAMVDATEGRLRTVRDLRGYRAARVDGAQGVMPAVQGGHALSGAPKDELDAWLAKRWLTRVTLVHLIDSVLGSTSSPLSLRPSGGLTDAGRELVYTLNRHRVFVDLAHINAQGFWDAVSIHDAEQPLIATHTGVTGVTPHWRNLDDKQVRAIADTGGVVGVIFAANFLGRRGGPRDVRCVLEHMQHVIDAGGEACAAIGSDYDGAIVPPGGMRDGLGYPRLVQGMLDQGWTPERIRRVLGANALEAFGRLRP